MDMVAADHGSCVWTQDSAGQWVPESFCDPGYICGSPPPTDEGDPLPKSPAGRVMTDAAFRLYLESRNISLAADATSVSLPCAAEVAVAVEIGQEPAA